jgi:hypothetical protein
MLLDHFLDGFTAVSGNSIQLFYLCHEKDPEPLKEAFAGAENVLLAFPLYTDCMPALVKAFIESLEPFCGRQGNPNIGFIVQSGFPEAAHSRYLERYLEKLTSRLGCGYTGTIIKGGGEGIRDTPAGRNKELFASFHQLGKTFGETGRFDEDLVRKLAEPERLPRLFTLVFALLARTRIATSYWDKQLKENDAFEKRFARPYEEVGCEGQV